jgi:hypothetical protein
VSRGQELIRILESVWDHHMTLIGGRNPFADGPMPRKDLEKAASIAAAMFRTDAVAADFAAGTDVRVELNSLLMTAWCGGFKAGAHSRGWEPPGWQDRVEAVRRSMTGRATEGN